MSTKSYKNPGQLLLSTALLFIFFNAALLPASGQRNPDRAQLNNREEVDKPVRLNNRNFQKNLERFSHELDLSSRQIKRLNKIDKKYSRRETRLASRPSSRKGQIRRLQKEKREKMISVLDYEQQKRLQQLSKTNFWDFLRARE